MVVIIVKNCLLIQSTKLIIIFECMGKMKKMEKIVSRAGGKQRLAEPIP
jgi:hypothetical protein